MKSKKKKIPEEVKLVLESKKKQSYSNKHISYSQLSSYMSCPLQWYLTYVKKLAVYQPSIYTVFGKAIHTTLQDWLKLLYEGTVREFEEIDINEKFYNNLVKSYKSEKFQNSHEHFSDSKEMQEFYQDGIQILEFIKKKRKSYFSSKNIYLAGIETLLYQKLKPGVYFKGYVDLVFYDKDLDKWTLIDIKTSTRGWNNYKKADSTTTAQLLLYKEFFSKQFNIPIDKIEVKYLIVKRKILENSEYATAKRRVQEFVPASGKIVRGRAVKSMNTFIDDTLDNKGEFVEKHYNTTDNINNCRFCSFKDNPVCPMSKKP